VKVVVFVAFNLTFLVLLLLSSGELHIQGASMVFDKSNFTNPLKIDNKYLPLKPGTTLIYEGKSDGDPTRDVFVVTNDTKEIMGIPTRIVQGKSRRVMGGRCERCQSRNSNGGRSQG
jgi:hypothetical protein